MTADPNEAVAELAAWASQVGLSPPPVPAAFAASLRRVDAHVWSTRTDAARPYAIRALQEELETGRGEDYLLLGADGHGMNSYALHWHCVEGPVSVLTQVRWGGVETQSAEHAARADAVLRDAEAVRRRVVSAARTGFRFAIVASDFSPCRYRVTGADGVSGGGRDAEDTVHGALGALDALGVP